MIRIMKLNFPNTVQRGTIRLFITSGAALCQPTASFHGVKPSARGCARAPRSTRMSCAAWDRVSWLTWALAAVKCLRC